MSVQGIGVSQGIIVGRVFLLEREGLNTVRRDIPADKVNSEVLRFQHAIQKTKNQLKKFRDKIKSELGDSHATLFDSHALILDDPMFLDPTIQMIKNEKINPEHAVHIVFLDYIEKLEKFDDPYLKARIADFRDVGRRLLLNLAGIEKNPLAKLEEKVIVVSFDLSPSETAAMDKTKVIGFVTESGSRTSHTAIMAKALEIPAVVGAQGITKTVRNGDVIILDGTHGTVIINPDRETLKEYLAAQKKSTVTDKELDNLRKLSAQTTDGIQIQLAANIELPDEVEHVKQYGGKGVGLFRTEFLYLYNTTLPSEEFSFKSYKQVVKSFAPEPVTIRTLDIGGDKFVSQLNLPSELNPFLGLRAIRLCLQRPELFKTQLRAILRASIFGNVKLMYPMISGLDELRQANAILEETKAELRQQGIPFKEDIPVGIMIEIPSAAIISDVLAKEVDFFSIGTNDLIQYTLAVDRGNENVAYLYEPLHPSILRLLKLIIESAHRGGARVSLCGEMAGDPDFTPILLGLGIDELSMAPPAIRGVKMKIRSISMADAHQLSNEIMELNSTDEIRQHLNQFHSKNIRK